MFSINRSILFLFQSTELLFPFLVLFTRQDLQYNVGWELRERMFLFSSQSWGGGEEFLIIKYDVSYMFFVDVLYRVEEISSVTSFLKSFPF